MPPATTRKRKSSLGRGTATKKITKRAAKSRRATFTKKRKKKSQSLDWSLPSLEVSPEIAREIAVLSFFGLGTIVTLSLFWVAGIVGESLSDFLSVLFGYGKYLVPALFFLLGSMKWLFVDFEIHNQRFFGIVLLVLSTLGLLHLWAPDYSSHSLDIYSGGQYGGYIGFLSSVLFVLYLGKIGGFVCLFFAFIISLLLTFELTLAQLYHILFEVEEENEVASASKPKCKAKETSEDVVAVISDTTKKKEASSLTINQFSDSKKEKKESFASVELKKIKPKKQTEEDIGIQTPSFDESDEEKWTPPALDLLEYTKNSVVINEKDLHASAKAIEEKLAQFGIEVSMNDVHVGPTVMQYTMRPAPGVKLSKIQGLTQDVALALQAHALRIEAPIPGTDLVGLEIPNKNRLAVSLREIFESDTFREMKSPLRIVMGRDVAGKPMVADLAKMPHVLVAGNTGSGKSVFVNTLLLSLLYQNSPNDLKLILVDPKQVELGSYNNIPHLLTPVINDAEKALSSLKWAVAEMNRRYREMAQKKVRHISEFNEQAKKEDRWPYIVIVIDEMADLMMTAGKDVEALIVRLAQMARAVGIHLVLATQRPSVNVITGLIKANVPTRVAFTVASQVDSRTIIDKAGAEALLGRGDFLFLMNGESNLTRVQSAYVTTEEVNNVVYKIRMNSPKDLETQKDLFEDEDVQEEINTVQVPGMEEKKSRGDMGDELYEEAVQVVVKHQKASATMLQRYLSVGYARAAKLIDLLEQEGVISPSEGSKPRKVYWKGQSGELDHSSDIVL